MGDGFSKISKEAQERMAKWPQERRDAVQLQGKLHYERCVPEASMLKPSVPVTDAAARAELTELVARIEALIAKAAPGPWTVDPDNRPGMHWNNHIVQTDDPNMTVCFMSHDGTPENVEGQANADLIVTLRNAWPVLREALSDARRKALSDEQDAKRYRWLRNVAAYHDWCELGGASKQTLDREIDAAMAKAE